MDIGRSISSSVMQFRHGPPVVRLCMLDSHCFDAALQQAQSWRGRRRPRRGVRPAPGLSVWSLMPITLLPLPAPSTMEMTLRSCLMRTKTPRRLRVRLATMRQHQTQPSSLSRLGLLPTMELAGTPHLKTSTVLDPTTFGQSLQVKFPCSTEAAFALSKLPPVSRMPFAFLSYF